MADHILTESGNRLLTEDGRFLVLALDFIPAGFIFVSAERGTFVSAVSERGTFVSAFSELATITTAIAESAVIGSGG